MRWHKPPHTWHCLYHGNTVRCRTPTVTQYYCDVCGVFATSEEQLVMHNEGKKHKRTVALKELTEGHLPSGPPGADGDGDAAQTGALPLFCKKGDCRGRVGGSSPVLKGWAQMEWVRRVEGGRKDCGWVQVGCSCREGGGGWQQ